MRSTFGRLQGKNYELIKDYELCTMNFELSRTMNYEL